MIGPTLFGWLSDRSGNRTGLIVLSTVVFGLTWGVFAAFGTIPLLLVGAIFLFSRILRGGIPLAFTVIKERHPEEASGTVIGLINTMGWIGAAVFPVVQVPHSTRTGPARPSTALASTRNPAIAWRSPSPRLPACSPRPVPSCCPSGRETSAPSSQTLT